MRNKLDDIHYNHNLNYIYITLYLNIKYFNKYESIEMQFY